MTQATEVQIRAFVFLVGAFLIYLLPTLIATIRKHHNGLPIALINVFLGWTFVGWIVAFIWSCTSPAPQQPIIIQQNFSQGFDRPEWERHVRPLRPPVILPQAHLPDHLFDKKRDE